MKNLTELKNSQIIRADFNYKEAINCPATNFFNFPCTLNYKDKKYVLGVGSSDEISVFKQGELLIILSKNNGLNYVSYSVLEIETGHEIDSYFLESNDLDLKDSIFYGLQNKTARYIAKYLQNL